MNSPQVIEQPEAPKSATSAPVRRVRRVIIRFTCLIFAMLAILVFAQHLFSRPDLTGFDPAEMGRVESKMWRDYYEGRWFSLGAETMQLSCGQYHFSWWDGARIATHTALSALHFRTRTDDPRCLPELEKFYCITERAAPMRFDVKEAARLELTWWKERRKSVSTQDYARTIAKLTTLIYGIPEIDTLPASRLRAEAMAYRDVRGNKMTEADWNELTRQLRAAYADFHAKLKPGHETTAL